MFIQFFGLVIILSSLPAFGQHIHRETAKSPVVENKLGEKKEEPRVMVDVPVEQQKKLGLRLKRLKKRI